MSLAAQLELHLVSSRVVQVSWPESANVFGDSSTKRVETLKDKQGKCLIISSL